MNNPSRVPTSTDGRTPMNLLLEPFEWHEEDNQTRGEKPKPTRKKRKTHGAKEEEGSGSGKA